MKKKFLILSILICVITSFSTNTFAGEIRENLSETEISSDFKKFSELSDEEKLQQEVIPEAVTVPESSGKVSNPVRYLAMVSAGSESSKRYSLKDENVIPENIVIKDQQTQGNCWTFTALSALETNLALQNLRNGKTKKVYDFSEKHMDYFLTRDNFLNGETNKYGLNRKVGSGGNWNIATSYLTNGFGAVNEQSMPYDNKTDKIPLSSLTSAQVTSDVQDLKYYPSKTNPSTEDIENMKEILKVDIQNNGAIASKVYFPSINSEYYNNLTGALYCNDTTKIVDHALAIVGWDDEYPVDNFNTNHKPSKPGAWLAKNSWGVETYCPLDEFKETLFETNKEYFTANGINSASNITDDLAKSVINELSTLGFRLDGKTVYYPVGDQGFVHISYEDKKVYEYLMSVVNATEQKDYDNNYFYNETGWAYSVEYNENKVFLGSKFSKKNNNNNELLTKIGLCVLDDTTCKVYANPNSQSINKSDLQAIELEQGSSVDLEPGFHTLKFKEPLKINSNNFSVVVEITNKTEDVVHVLGEANIDNNIYSVVNIENDKCFMTSASEFNQGKWQDLSKISSIQGHSLKNMDSTIHAYTTVGQATTPTPVSTPELERIEVTSQPYNVEYTVGQNFDKSGLVVTAYYDDSSSKTITDYQLINNTNLQEGHQKVTITYNGKTAYIDVNVRKESSSPTPSEENNEDNDETTVPHNSNFNNLDCEVISANSEKNTIKLRIKNFYQNKNNDTMKYSYYLSSGTTIPSSKFIEVTEPTIGENYLEFEINVSELDNYNELVSAQNVYVFIKELASKNNTSSEVTSNAIKISLTKETTVDDKKIDESTQPIITKKYEINDDTVAKDPIPQTGVAPVILVIFLLSTVSISLFIKYLTIRKKMK